MVPITLQCCTSHKLIGPMHRTGPQSFPPHVRCQNNISSCSLPPAYSDLADALQDSSMAQVVPFALALLGAAASLVAARAATYARRQYILAALLGSRVPPNTTTVLQLAGSTRDLYYYPASVQRVTVVDPAAKPGRLLLLLTRTHCMSLHTPFVSQGLWEQAGMTAGVPVELRTQAPQTLLFARDASVGAVVATSPLTDCADLPQLIGEIARVLQPGGVFVFMQRLADGGAVQGIVGDPARSVGAYAVTAFMFTLALASLQTLLRLKQHWRRGRMLLTGLK